MRVAIVANTAWYLVNFRLNLIRALRNAGHIVVAVAPPDQKHVARLTSEGAEFAPVAISGSGTRPWQEAASIYNLRQAFIRHRVELVLSYTPKGNVYAGFAALSLNLPYIPNVSGLGRAFIRRSWVTQVVKILYRLTLGRARRVFFQNLDDLELLVNAGLLPRDRCERLPGSGVDLTRFVPQPVPERPAKEVVFLLVARMLWDKGVGEFVDAARAISAVYPAARFRLLGFVDFDNPSAISRSQLRLWEDEGLVSYLGATDDVRPYLEQADCVVLPSYREGVPRTLLEAAAMARPVITSDAPGCRDAVIDGVTGFRCRVRDSTDLISRMCMFIELPRVARAAMGANGRTRVEQEYDERIVIAYYLREIESLAGDLGESPAAA